LPATDREVFAYFCADPETPREIDYLAYAAYANEKYQWMAHFENAKNRPPTLAEENDWISNLPDTRLEAITRESYAFFKYAAHRYLNEEIEEEKAAAINNSILDRVKEATSFTSTFIPNLFIGLMASLLFSVLIIIFGAIFNRDPSPIALFKAIVPSKQ
jgi:hypothetical protein